MKKTIVAYTELCKVRIGLLSSLSAATGFLLSCTEVGSQIVILLLGVFLLACGASALNQYQEQKTDAAMPRTCNRPLPSGRISPVNALSFSVALLISGCAALLLTGNAAAALLGLFAVLWYNGVYTFLKKITAFAVVPGALTGAIPPAIGWITGGGGFTETKLLMLCFFFFIWQVPHSWLLIMNYGREYEKAGLPVLTKIFSSLQMKRIIFNWLLATVLSCLFLAAMGLVHYFPTYLALLLLCAWLLWNGIRPVLNRTEEDLSGPAFRKTNYYLVMVMLLLWTDRLLLIKRLTLPLP